ncbi:MAG: hypothetical protein MJ087_01505 [Lachnospiraceae bacterium]|nr:hypothetical protein [Lachnospiraceae bacterium]
MTEKELRSLRRADLLEMLVTAGKQLEETKAAFAKKEQEMIASHEETVQSLQSKLAKTEEKLNERNIAIDNAGSLAEASLAINGVIAAAQNAADQYLENIKTKYATIDAQCEIREKEMMDRIAVMEAEIKQRCFAREAESQSKADKVVTEASVKAAGILQQAQDEANRILGAAKIKESEIDSKCAVIEAQAKAAAQKHFDEANAKLQEVISTHEYLQSMFSGLGGLMK